jgi:hypothetical protein
MLSLKLLNEEITERQNDKKKLMKKFLDQFYIPDKQHVA